MVFECCCGLVPSHPPTGRLQVPRESPDEIFLLHRRLLLGKFCSRNRQCYAGHGLLVVRKEQILHSASECWVVCAQNGWILEVLCKISCRYKVWLLNAAVLSKKKRRTCIVYAVFFYYFTQCFLEILTRKMQLHAPSCCSSICADCLVLSAVLPHLRSNFCLSSHYCSWSSHLLHLLGILTLRCVRSPTSWGSAFWGATLPHCCCFLPPLCVSLGFAGVAMRVGEEVSIKEAGNGSRMWESRGAMQRRGKRQWLKGSSQWGDRLALLPVQKICVFVFSGWAGIHVKNILLGAETLLYLFHMSLHSGF